MFLSLFYIISYLALLTGILFFKKNDKKLSLLVWITMAVMTSFCCQAAAAALLYKTGLPVAMSVIAVFNLVTGGILWFFIIRKGRQNYYLDKTDLIAFIILGLVAGFTYAKRFTIGHDISFASVDSATLYDLAKIIVMNKKLATNMFFATVNSAMPMQAGLPITGEFYMFKTFILWEAGYFLLSGLFFYILIREFLKNRGLKIFGIVASVIYMLGYPMYSLIFGFSYFGLSISVIAYIIYAAILYIDGNVGKLNCVLMLNLGLLGLFLCYMLFVPAIFPGVLLAILIYMKKTGKLFSVRTIKSGLSIFLAPSIAGMLVTASNLIFLSSGSAGSGSSGGGDSVSQGPTGIAIDGGCYNDMYSNFILLLPFIVTGLSVCVNKLRNGRLVKDELPAENMKEEGISHATVILSVFTVMLIFMAVMFAGVMTGRVSVYYYVRNNNVLMLLSWMLVIFGASEMWDRAKPVYISFLAVFAALILMIMTGVDSRILDKNDRTIRVGAESFLDIYYFNNEFNKFVGDVNINDIEMLKYFTETISPTLKGEDGEVAVIGGAVYTAWYAKLTGNDKIRAINDSVTLSGADLSDSRYICVQKLDIYEENKDIIDTLGEVVYSSERGLIIKNGE